MPKFSKSSQEKLVTCDPRIQEIMNEAIKMFDFTVIFGHRTHEEQEKLVSEGKSQIMNSKHLSNPSMAIDIAPYSKPIDWTNNRRFIYLAGHIMAIAETKNIPLRWGGDWDRDTKLKDNNFNDLCHFELV
jgi:peptidoglycan LD-endopeptidase CwlK